MNENQRHNIAAALRACLPHLWDGKSRRIAGRCYAICAALTESGASYSKAARRLVMQRLGGYSTVPQWLQWKANISPRKLTTTKVQAYRRAWVQHLIKELES